MLLWGKKRKRNNIGKCHSKKKKRGEKEKKKKDT
jgi:hypothetical protein